MHNCFFNEHQKRGKKKRQDAEVVTCDLKLGLALLSQLCSIEQTHSKMAKRILSLSKH
jgi:hypothetical protein